MKLYRTFLFTPGNHPRRVEKVFSVGADAVILDLEDAVANAEKKSTRRTVVEALSKPRDCLGYIRVNSMGTEWCFGDLCEVVRPGVDGIMLPKVESAADLRAVDWVLGCLEREQGLAAGSIDLLPIIETGKGLAHIDAIAGCGSRVRRIAFGAGDFTLDMNLIWSREEGELEHARAKIVLASRAAGLDPPIDTVWIRLKDPDGLRASAQTSLRMGFQGRLCIHPDQIGVVHEVFTPTAEEFARAQKVVDAFTEAERNGLASIQVDGQFIDYPIVYKAQRVVATMEKIRAKGG
jgi:citrate lyase subunit beta/citryl-CoA lyase